MQIKIVSGVADVTKIAQKPGSGRPRIYPFDKMGVSDGFLMPNEGTKQNNIMHAAYKFAKEQEPPMQFSKRTDADGNKWCVRIK